MLDNFYPRILDSTRHTAESRAGSLRESMGLRTCAKIVVPRQGSE